MATLALVVLTFVLFSSDSALQQAVNQLKIPADRTPPAPFTHPRWGELRDFVLLVSGIITAFLEAGVLIAVGFLFQNTQNLIISYITLGITILGVGYLCGISGLHFFRVIFRIPEKEQELAQQEQSFIVFVVIFVSTEFALGFDNLLAVLSLTKDPWILGAGVIFSLAIILLGIQRIRVVLESFPTTKHAGQLILLLLGISMFLSLFHIEIPQWIEESGVIIVLICGILWDYFRRKEQVGEEHFYELVPASGDNLIGEGSFVIKKGENNATLTLKLRKGRFPVGDGNTVLCLPENRGGAKYYVTPLLRTSSAMEVFSNSIKSELLRPDATSVVDADEQLDVIGFSGGSGDSAHHIGVYSRDENIILDLNRILWGKSVQLLPGIKYAITVATKPGVSCLFIVVLLTGKCTDLEAVIDWTKEQAAILYAERDLPLELKTCLPVKFLLLGTHKADQTQGRVLDDMDITHTSQFGVDLWDYKFIPNICQVLTFCSNLRQEGLLITSEIVGFGIVSTDIEGVINAHNEPLRETMTFSGLSPSTRSVVVRDENGREHSAYIRPI